MSYARYMLHNVSLGRGGMEMIYLTQHWYVLKSFLTIQSKDAISKKMLAMILFNSYKCRIEKEHTDCIQYGIFKKIVIADTKFHLKFCSPHHKQ